MNSAMLNSRCAPFLNDSEGSVAAIAAGRDYFDGSLSSPRPRGSLGSMSEWVFGKTEASAVQCRCCGRETRQLVGTVFESSSDVPTAFFTTVVTPGHPKPRVKVALCIGDLSERGQRANRQIIAMEI